MNTFWNRLLSGMILLLTLGLAVAPVVAVIGFALTAASSPQPSAALRYDKFALVANTLALALGTIGLTMPIGCLTALLLFRTDLKGSPVFLGLLLVAMFVPLDLQASAWLATIKPQGPLLAPPAFFSVVWIHMMASIPWVVLLGGVAFMQVERSLEEESLLVSSPWRTIRQVTLRRAAPGLAAVALFVVVQVSGEMAVTDLFQVRSYAETVYTDFALYGRPESALRTALPGLALLVVLVAIAGQLAARSAPLRGGLLFSACRFRLGGARPVWYCYIVFVLMATLGVPTGFLAWKAGLVYPAMELAVEPELRVDSESATESLPAARVSYWSATRTVRSVMTSAREVGDQLIYSLSLAVATASIAVGGAWYLIWNSRAGPPISWIGYALCVLLLALPGPVVGAGVSLVSNSCAALSAKTGLGPVVDWLVDSPLVLIWVLLLRTFPYVLLILWPAFKAIDPATLEAAELDGAGPVSRFRLIVLPLSRTASAAAFLICAVLCLGELSATVIVSPPGLQPLSVGIFTLVHNGVDSYLAGICLVLEAVSAATILLLIAIARSPVGRP